MDSEYNDLEIKIRSMTHAEAKNWVFTKECKTLLPQWWEEHYPNIIPKNKGEILYVIRSGVSPFCSRGNHKNFDILSTGYYTTCTNSTNKECECLRETQISTCKRINTKENREKSRNTMLERYGVDNYAKLPECHQKMKATTQERYGCDYSLQSAEVREKAKATMLTRYGVTNAQFIPGVKEKTKATNLEKYGVEHTFQTIEVKEKSKNTMLTRYGVEHALQSPEFQEKKQQTMMNNWGFPFAWQHPDIIQKIQKTHLERYGVKNPLSFFEFREKSKITMLERYGVEHASQSPEIQGKIREKTRNTSMQKWGVPCVTQRHLSTETLDILNNKEKFTEIITNQTFNKIAKMLNISSSSVANYAAKYEVRHLMKIDVGSAMQNKLSEWILSLGENVLLNTRKIITPLELDIYLPDRNFAIEFNGIYYHSERSNNNKNSQYHKNKYEQCLKKGIQLIQVCSLDYEKQPELIENLILKKLGRLPKLELTSCSTICLIETTIVTDFLNENHIHQIPLMENDICLGVIHNNTLIQLMVFSEFLENNFIITNYTTKKGIICPEGQSLLINKFIEEYNPSTMVHFSNLSYFTGNSFSKLGFVKTLETLPSFKYTDYKRTYDTLLEGENVESYDKIWDCGQAIWEWSK
jgi:hypothetical protein